MIIVEADDRTSSQVVVACVQTQQLRLLVCWARHQRHRRYPARTPSARSDAGPQEDASGQTCVGDTARSTAMITTRVALHATELRASRIFAESIKLLYVILYFM